MDYSNSELTMKQIRVIKIINECSNEMRDIYNLLVQLKVAFKAGEVKACKARREYKKAMDRAAFYNKISFRLSEKYGHSRDFDIKNFNDVIDFFECW